MSDGGQFEKVVEIALSKKEKYLNSGDTLFFFFLFLLSFLRSSFVLYSLTPLLPPFLPSFVLSFLVRCQCVSNHFSFTDVVLAGVSVPSGEVCDAVRATGAQDVAQSWETWAFTLDTNKIDPPRGCSPGSEGRVCLGNYRVPPPSSASQR
eukprot:INCI1385.2.p1 GENE.INCI1385.2~~INCI1385.2.p1  ORF type:complete len:150 (-),score=18.33 INCI1385.2:247-696(-)